MKPKCPGQSFSPLLHVMHVASFWFTPCVTDRERFRTFRLKQQQHRAYENTYQFVVEHTVRMGRARGVVGVYGVQVPGIDA